MLSKGENRASKQCAKPDDYPANKAGSYSGFASKRYKEQLMLILCGMVHDH